MSPNANQFSDDYKNIAAKINALEQALRTLKSNDFIIVSEHFEAASEDYEMLGGVEAEDFVQESPLETKIRFWRTVLSGTIEEVQAKLSTINFKFYTDEIQMTAFAIARAKGDLKLHQLLDNYGVLYSLQNVRDSRIQAVFDESLPDMVKRITGLDHVIQQSDDSKSPESGYEGPSSFDFFEIKSEMPSVEMPPKHDYDDYGFGLFDKEEPPVVVSVIVEVKSDCPDGTTGLPLMYLLPPKKQNDLGVVVAQQDIYPLQSDSRPAILPQFSNINSSVDKLLDDKPELDYTDGNCGEESRSSRSDKRDCYLS